MEIEDGYLSLTEFKHEGKKQSVKFVEKMLVTEGVECDVYSFVNDTTKDLGIIKIDPDRKAPLQKVLQGDKTIEGYISGVGRLYITRSDSTHEIHEVGKISDEKFAVNVRIGDTMQWQASER